MKPKVKIYSYESWSSQEYNGISTIKQDSPMDLSVKRAPTEHSIESLHIRSDSDREHISTNLYNCRLPLYDCKHDGNSPNLLPYLLLHKNCDSVYQNTSLRSDQLNEYSNVYSSAQSQSQKLTLDSEFCDDRRVRRENGESGDYDYSRHTFHATSDNHRRLSDYYGYLDSNFSKSVEITGNGSHLFSNGYVYCGLKKANSETSLEKFCKEDAPLFGIQKRWKSENDLLHVCDALSSNLHSKVDQMQHSFRVMPRKVNAAVHVPFGMERSIRLSDEEDMTSDEFECEDALDLRVCSNTNRSHRIQHQPNFESDLLFRNIRSLLSSNCEHPKDTFANFTSINPWEAYKQYYYYLLNQPSLASRAAVAAAMADTYTKFMSSNANSLTEPPNSPLCDVSIQKYNLESTLDGKAELRSADTTNGLDVNTERKRISRPLTGRHVRHGTGASPSTLLSLRRMIQERQRLKQLGLNCAQNKQKSRRNHKKK